MLGRRERRAREEGEVYEEGGEEGEKVGERMEGGGGREEHTIVSLLGEAIHIGGVVWVVVGRPPRHHIGLLVERHLLLWRPAETVSQAALKSYRLHSPKCDQLKGYV